MPLPGLIEVKLLTIRLPDELCEVLVIPGMVLQVVCQESAEEVCTPVISTHVENPLVLSCWALETVGGTSAGGKTMRLACWLLSRWKTARWKTSSSKNFQVSVMPSVSQKKSLSPWVWHRLFPAFWQAKPSSEDDNPQMKTLLLWLEATLDLLIWSERLNVYTVSSRLNVVHMKCKQIVKRDKVDKIFWQISYLLCICCTCVCGDGTEKRSSPGAIQSWSVCGLCWCCLPSPVGLLSELSWCFYPCSCKMWSLYLIKIAHTQKMANWTLFQAF